MNFDTAQAFYTPLPFDAIRPCECYRCLDTGFWLTPRGEVLSCPRVEMREPHPETGVAARTLRRATDRLLVEGREISSVEFNLAQILTLYTADEPCQRKVLISHFFGDTNLTHSNSLRKLHSMIENLRRQWLLPIGGRKAEPAGYWVITMLAEYKEWYRSVTAAPITQLSTIHKNAKHNFPHFAEQMELNFWSDMGPGNND
ncbi:MAG TPA: hypothetical protein VMM38_01475 [Aridibacter sp.]|nr:hypothetical protein [Aridibacter sp.]